MREIQDEGRRTLAHLRAGGDGRSTPVTGPNSADEGGFRDGPRPDVTTGAAGEAQEEASLRPMRLIIKPMWRLEIQRSLPILSAPWFSHIVDRLAPSSRRTIITCEVWSFARIDVAQRRT
jgi:hypothetical protein